MQMPRQCVRTCGILRVFDFVTSFTAENARYFRHRPFEGIKPTPLEFAQERHAFDHMGTNRTASDPKPHIWPR